MLLFLAALSSCVQASCNSSGVAPCSSHGARKDEQLTHVERAWNLTPRMNVGVMGDVHRSELSMAAGYVRCFYGEDT